MKIITLSPKRISEFRTAVYNHYSSSIWAFKWRKTSDPYHILISEFMLQQTQTSRVEEKYDVFIKRYKDICSLADSDKKDLLQLWQGLGYNRRALYLHETAKIICKDYNGSVPDDYDNLLRLPGIGPYTASAILTFAYNKPQIFIETNIRTVFIHYFFIKNGTVKDKEILNLVDQTLDRKNLREWHYALMDYGVTIKKTHGNPNKKSKHYTKQSKFEGSNRQKRGLIIKKLTEDNEIEKSTLVDELNITRSGLNEIIKKLEIEGFLVRDHSKITLQ